MFDIPFIALILENKVILQEFQLISRLEQGKRGKAGL